MDFVQNSSVSKINGEGCELCLKSMIEKQYAEALNNALQSDDFISLLEEIEDIARKTININPAIKHSAS
ncbi:MAG: hypothetical protein ACC651_17465 [Candidatus Scalindua sp.]